ncbi:MAG TPA: manganese efflux pump MntP family protein, partial [Anaerolineales bacterium]|nr:manganese efflux pump MntP family protein [Anaerolineales bacterium]
PFLSFHRRRLEFSSELQHMTVLEVLLLAVSMAVDAFAVCMAAGALPGTHGPREAFRLAFHFGLFQFLMPIIGWLAGTEMEVFIRDVDHWVAFGLLACVGGRMIYSAWQAEQRMDSDPSRGWMLVVLSIAVSVDALAVGLSLGLVGVPVIFPSILIGLVTGILSLAGLQVGAKAGQRLGPAVQVGGGLVLIAIGARILAQHLML